MGRATLRVEPLSSLMHSVVPPPLLLLDVTCERILGAAKVFNNALRIWRHGFASVIKPVNGQLVAERNGVNWRVLAYFQQ